MEEEKAVKKNNKPMLVMAVAVLFILAGVALIVTGNNKSFLAKEEAKPKEDNNNSENQEIVEEPPRVIIPEGLTNDEVANLISEKKQAEFSEETWTLGSVSIIGHDEKNEKYLVTYEEIQEDGSVVAKLTIVSVLNDVKSVELPGWIEGERDLTVYNFIYENGSTEPVEPVEPVEPTEPVVPTEPVENIMPEEVVENVDQP